MREWGLLPADKQGTQGPTQKAGQTPEPVKGGHNCLTIVCLHPYSLRVDRNVEQIAGETKERQRGSQRPEVFGPAQQGQKHRVHSSR
ncbi:hypothetical protein SAMN00120144_1320 [Hymenobacter roseosalivarius DSM 11622]|uniref:Uncharacterized protein n=1 Tax=Hymenobacter roseosalivarius DSM 11622 TaxID=645990 RepID=A0A1W1W4P5_9BACT|nr:hypothetical protein SAMN00120144_1320 [Hymenobacter roseosalivarius DSM 11622]